MLWHGPQATAEICMLSEATNPGLGQNLCQARAADAQHQYIA